MTHFLRRTAATLASSVLLTAGLAGAAQAAPPPHAAVMTGVQHAADAELPAQAQRGSGMTGLLNATARGAAALSFTTADGRELKAHRQRQAQDARGTTSWVGTFDDQPGSLVVMTTHKGVTTGFISYGSETFELMPGRGGKHVMYKVNEAILPQGETILYPTPIAGDTGGVSDYGTGGASADAAAAGTVHDVLVVYTPASRVRYGQAAIESMILSAVQAANQAYQNSGVGIALNLVGLQEINYDESGPIDTSLYDLRGNGDGKMDSVHALRDQLGADMVSLVSQDGDACGIAWTMRSVGTSFASSAFSVVYSGCLSSHSFAHELGHNQGNMHDRVSSSAGGAYAYSYGFRRCASDGTGFRTVMSYSCTGANRVTQFSNPAVSYNGYATGISYESDPANSADNSRSMNNTAATVAAFRGASGGSATPPAAPSALSATANSASSVTARWTDNSSNESGFRLERSINGVDFTEIATIGAGTTSFADNGVAARTSYWYRARAYNSTGNSAYSNTGSVTTPDVAPAAPATPAAVSAANNGDGSAGVSWSAASGASSYEVIRETWDSHRNRWKASTTVASVPSSLLAIVDLSGAGTFRYGVRAVNAGGGSGYGGPAEVSVSGGTSNSGKGGSKRKNGG